MFRYSFVSTVVVVLAVLSGTARAGTLDDVRARGSLVCGVSTGVPGFSMQDRNGRWGGLDAEICRAIAAAALGEAFRVDFVPLTAAQRFDALAERRIDVLVRNTTLSYFRESGRGFASAGIAFYDGQGFMVPRALQAKRPEDLAGRSVCVKRGTTTERNLADWFRTRNLSVRALSVDDDKALGDSYFAGRCEAVTADASQLAVLLAAEPQGDRHEILNTVISKEPLGPLVRQDDPRWHNLVRWVLMALIEAEEHGIGQANVENVRKSSQDPYIRRLLGIDPGLGLPLGLDDAWAYRAVRLVGNYGDIFDRSLGKRSRFRLQRGLNDLWVRGGLLYALPFR